MIGRDHKKMKIDKQIQQMNDNFVVGRGAWQYILHFKYNPEFNYGSMLNLSSTTIHWIGNK